MIATHQAFVAARFDAVHARFRTEVAEQDFRLAALRRALGPVRDKQILDLGCGKGRFGWWLSNAGARVTGLDVSRSMLRDAHHCSRVHGSACRLPFANGAFEGVIAVEVFQHLPARAIADVLRELLRVARPGARVAIIDNNLLALDAHRRWLPRAVVKWIDERRGLWMYKAGEPVRERWFLPRSFARDMRQHFRDVRTEYLMGPRERGCSPFERHPWLRSFVCWSATAPEAVNE